MIKRKLYFCILIFTSALLTPLFAQDKETLAVLDFQTEAVSKTEMGAIVEFLSAELFNTDKYIVIDVSQRQTILKEMEFSNSGCTDDSCALEIGKLLSAELIVTGNLSKVGSRYLLSAKMLQTETSRTVGTANGKFGNLDDLIDGLEEIAATLSGAEKADVTAAAADTTVTAAENGNIKETPVQTAADVKTDDTEKPADNSADEAEPAAKPETGLPEKKEIAEKENGFNLPAFFVSAAGAAGYTASGIFRSISFVNRLDAEAAYSDYMSAADNSWLLYAGDGGQSYQQYFYDYERNSTIGYITSGLGGALSPGGFYIGDSYMSFGGRLSYGIAAMAFAAGNVFSVISTNFAFNSIKAYDDYISAGSATSEELWYIYEDEFNNYQACQYTGIGLWGLGGLLSIGSALIPGEKTAAASSLVEKIILTAGYLFLAGGNFTASAAMNTRFNAEDAYADYMSAGGSSAADLFEVYQAYQNNYEILSYTSFGLWGAGAAAVAAAMLIPFDSGAADSMSAENISVRPSLTGFGVEVELKLK